MTGIKPLQNTRDKALYGIVRNIQICGRDALYTFSFADLHDSYKII